MYKQSTLTQTYKHRVDVPWDPLYWKNLIYRCFHLDAWIPSFCYCSPSMVRCFGTRNPKVALNQDSGFASFRDYTSIILGLETTSSRILPAHYTSIEFRCFSPIAP